MRKPSARATKPKPKAKPKPKPKAKPKGRTRKRGGDRSDLVTRAKAPLVAAVRRGATIKASCAAAGIARQTWYAWRNLARDGVAPYAKLWAEIQEARGEAIQRMELALVTAAESGDVRAILGYLERQAPEQWARPDVRSESLRLVRQIVGSASERMSDAARYEMIQALATEAGIDPTEIDGGERAGAVPGRGSA